MFLRKGQINSHLITYTLLIVVVGSIVVFGYIQITKIGDKADTVGIVLSSNRIKEDVAQISNEHESIQVFYYTVPTEAREICFVGSESNSISQGLAIKYPLIEDAVVAGARENMFFMGENGQILLSKDVGELKVKGPGYVCYANIGERIGIILAGETGKTLVGGTFENTLLVPAGTNPEETITVRGIDGLELKIPQNIGLAQETLITLKIEKSDFGDSDSYGVEADPPILRGAIASPLILTVPLPEGVSCPVRYHTGLMEGRNELVVDSIRCIDEDRASFEIGYTDI